MPTATSLEIDWRVALERIAHGDRYEIRELPGGNYVLEEHAFVVAVIGWPAREEAEARAALSQRSFARCGRPNCGIRLGPGKQAGDSCGHHEEDKPK